MLFIISTQKLDCEQSLILLLSHSGPIAQSTREGRGARGEAARGSPCVALMKEGRPLAVYKKVLFTARPVDSLFTFCPNLSNCQSECEVCCSDVNVIPNLSIVPKKLVMVTLKLTELHSENRPILPCKQRFLSCAWLLA